MKPYLVKVLLLNALCISGVFAMRHAPRDDFADSSSLPVIPSAASLLATVKNGVILAVWSGGREALDAGDRLPSARRLQGA
jgi:hypothetical protein